MWKTKTYPTKDFQRHIIAHSITLKIILKKFQTINSRYLHTIYHEYKHSFAKKTVSRTRQKKSFLVICKKLFQILLKKILIRLSVFWTFKNNLIL